MSPTVAFVTTGIVGRIIHSIAKVDYRGERIPLQAAIHRTLLAFTRASSSTS